MTINDLEKLNSPYIVETEKDLIVFRKVASDAITNSVFLLIASIVVIFLGYLNYWLGASLSVALMILFILDIITGLTAVITNIVFLYPLLLIITRFTKNKDSLSGSLGYKLGACLVRALESGVNVYLFVLILNALKSKF
ncbi:MAG TPA: hypothetical protein VMR81_00675 [Patescibacteria group bacterium]|nr:hypothetical protein [Patescibacteria group bacterium]